MEVLLLGTGSADGWPNPWCRCASCTWARDTGTLRVDDRRPRRRRAARRLRSGRAAAGRPRGRRASPTCASCCSPTRTPTTSRRRRCCRGRGPAARRRCACSGPQSAIDACRDWVGPHDPVSLEVVAPGDVLDLDGYVVRPLAAAHDVGRDELDPRRAALRRHRARRRPAAARHRHRTARRRHDGGGRAVRRTTWSCSRSRSATGSTTARDTSTSRPSPRRSAALRAVGAVVDGTDVVAVHLSHHNPPRRRARAHPRSRGARASSTTSTVLVAPGVPRALRAATATPARPRRCALGQVARGRAPAARATRASATSRPAASARTTPSGAARVATHRDRRPATWETVETLDVADVLAAASAGDARARRLRRAVARRTARRGARVGHRARHARAGGVARRRRARLRRRWSPRSRSTAAHVVLVSNEVGQRRRAGARVRPALPRPARRPQPPPRRGVRRRRPRRRRTRGAAVRPRRTRDTPTARPARVLAVPDPGAAAVTDALDLADLVGRIGLPDADARDAAVARQARLTKPAGALGRLEDLSVWLSRRAGRVPAAAARPGPRRRLRRRPRRRAHRGHERLPARGHRADGAQLPRRRRGRERARAPERRDRPRRRHGGRRRLRRARRDRARRGHPLSGTPVVRVDRPRGRPHPRGVRAGDPRRHPRSPTRRSTPARTCSSPATWASATPRRRRCSSACSARSTPRSVVGRGTGIDDTTWMRKTAAIRDAMRRGRPLKGDMVDLLAAVGGADIAAMTGFLLAASARRTPVLLDGVVSTAAAVVAHRLAFRAREWWLAGSPLDRAGAARGARPPRPHAARRLPAAPRRGHRRPRRRCRCSTPPARRCARWRRSTRPASPTASPDARRAAPRPRDAHRDPRARAATGRPRGGRPGDAAGAGRRRRARPLRRGRRST